MYHVNPQGKILPCNAKVRVCPYGQENHAQRKEELYPIIVEQFTTVDTSEQTRLLVMRKGIDGSLKTIDDLVKESDAPLETIVVSISNMLKALDKPAESEYQYYNGDDELIEVMTPEMERDYERYVRSVTDAYRYKLGSEPEVQAVPATFLNRGASIFIKEYDRDYAYRGANEPTELTIAMHIIRKETKQMKALEKQINERRRIRQRQMATGKTYKKSTVNERTPEQTELAREKLQQEFNYFSDLLNRSKINTLPQWSGDPMDIIDVIEKQSTEELLGIVEDNVMRRKDVERLRGREFTWVNRKDLSEESNEKMRDWAQLQNDIYNARVQQNAQMRMLTAMYAHDELAYRGVVIELPVRRWE